MKRQGCQTVKLLRGEVRRQQIDTTITLVAILAIEFFLILLATMR